MPTADSILREKPLTASYLIEAAWSGNRTQRVDADGDIMASVVATSSDSGYPVSKIIDGQEWHYDTLADQDNNYWRKTSPTLYDHTTHYVDLTSGYGTVTNNSLLDVVSKFTIRFWVYITASAFNEGFVSRTSFASSQGDWALGMFTGSGREVVFRLNNADVGLVGSALALNTWYFIEASYDPSLGSNNMKIFIDGVLDIQGTYNTPITNTAVPLIIGGYFDPGFTLDGRLSEVEFCNSIVRNTAGYTAPNIITPDSNTTGFWRMYEDAASTIAHEEINTLNAAMTVTYTWTETSTNATIAFGVSTAMNEAVVYQHPLLTNLSAFKLFASTDGLYYKQVHDATAAGTKVTATLTEASYTHLRLVPVTGTVARICEIQVHLWTDESSRLSWPDGSEPEISWSSKSEDGENATRTPTELMLAFVNADGRFNPSNASSPIYGIEGPDGFGSGVRGGVPIRVKATATSISGSFTQQVFFGYLGTDDDPGGVDGIDIDTENDVCTIEARSPLVKFMKDCNKPVYENAAFDIVVKDLALRSGMAWQDLDLGSVNQRVPFLAYPEGPAMEVLNDMKEALPFMTIHEEFDPQWKLVIRNYGRSRSDIDLNQRIGNAGISSSNISQRSRTMISLPSMKRMFIFDRSASPQQVWLWDMNYPADHFGLTKFGTSSALDNGMFYIRIGNTLYMVNDTGAVKSFDMSASTLGSVTAVGTFSGIVGGFTTLVTAVNYGNFIYCVMSNGASDRLFVWDTTQAFATTVSKGVLTNQVFRNTNRTGNNNVGTSGVCVDDKYFWYRYFGSQNTFAIWNHAGDPYVTALSTVNRTIFSSLTIGGETYENNTLAYTNVAEATFGSATTGARIAFIYVAVIKASSLLRHEIWALDLDESFTSSTLAVKLATIKDDSTEVAVVPGNSTLEHRDSDSIVVLGNYVYVMDSQCNAWVYDTRKDPAFLFQLGFNMPLLATPTIFPQYCPFYQSLSPQTPKSGGGAPPDIGIHRGPVLNGLDHSNGIWYAKNDPNGSWPFRYGCFLSFTVQGVDQFPSSPDAAFDSSVGFVENIKVQHGDPVGNVIRSEPSPFSVSQLPTYLWTQGPQPIIFPGGKITSIIIPIQTPSVRGRNPQDLGNNYYRAISFTTVTGTNIVKDDPNTTTSITIDGTAYDVTFYGFGDICILKIDCTGKPTARVRATIIEGRAVTQANNRTTFELQDDVSISLYNGREYPKIINSPAFNDDSFIQDLLLNFKYSRPRLEPLQLPWYPIGRPGLFFDVTDPRSNLPTTRFLVTECSTKGFRTEIKGKIVFSGYTI